jgi:hypothetical protein
MLALPVSDIIEQRMQIAFIFTATCWALWWNIQWKKVMRFWVRPPNREWVMLLFRIFFVLCFVGALGGLVQDLHQNPLAKSEILPTAEIAATMCTVVALMTALGLRMIDSRDRETASGDRT